jgi:hypothetical protein
MRRSILISLGIVLAAAAARAQTLLPFRSAAPAREENRQGDAEDVVGEHAATTSPPAGRTG